jgi:hypothetical protein
MKLDEKILTRLEELIAVGDRVLATKTESGAIGGWDFVDNQIAAQWGVRARLPTTSLSMGSKLAFCLGKGPPEKGGYTLTAP